MTKHSSNQRIEALNCFQKAEKLDPKNPLSKYQKATVLDALERYTEAKAVLEELSQMCPKEAPIHILLGKIYKKIGDLPSAKKHFETALDLDPKDTNMVKSLIEKIYSSADVNDDADL